MTIATLKMIETAINNELEKRRMEKERLEAEYRSAEDTAFETFGDKKGEKEIYDFLFQLKVKHDRDKAIKAYSEMSKAYIEFIEKDWN